MIPSNTVQESTTIKIKAAAHLYRWAVIVTSPSGLSLLPVWAGGRSHFSLLSGSSRTPVSMSSLPASLKRIRSTATEKKGVTSIFICSRAAYSLVSLQIWSNFKLIQALMYVLVTCKYKKDQIINSCEKVETPSFP